jgi:hypothetical protein
VPSLVNISLHNIKYSKTRIITSVIILGRGLLEDEVTEISLEIMTIVK